MPTVTYHAQPAIHATRGSVPLAGNAHVYTVGKVLWPGELEKLLIGHLVGQSLHICCGKSKLGDCRLDIFEDAIDVRADAAKLPFSDQSWDTVLIDPPYNGKFQWNHDMLSELGRVASQRIIFQHWFLITDKLGRFKKNHKFQLCHVYVWQPRTYFGRAQIISVLDADGDVNHQLQFQL